MVTGSSPAADSFLVFEYPPEFAVSNTILGDGFFAPLVNLPAYQDQELAALVEKLEREERELSDRRLLLQGAIDVIRAELASRAQEWVHGKGRKP